MSKFTNQMKRGLRGRGHDNKGRSKRGERFVKLPYWLLESPAWRSLKPQARALYIELSQRYNGFNNGSISMSVREAECALHISKNTASKYFHDLEGKGFIRRNICGSFNYKLRHATTWVLTQHPVNDDPATKDFMSWRPLKTKRGPKPEPNCPNRGTDDDNSGQLERFAVLILGPWPRYCTVTRSQFAAHI